MNEWIPQISELGIHPKRIQKGELSQIEEY